MLNVAERFLATAVAITVTVVACTGAAPPAASDTRTDVAPPPSPGLSPSPSATTPTSPTARSPGPDEFVNPVIDADFPDPFVLEVDGTYYAYATTNGTLNVQVARSDDLVDWEMLGDALPQLPSWSGPSTTFSETPQNLTWAPDVAQIGDTFVLYYTTPALEAPTFAGRTPQCISRAISASPEGPFEDTSDEPFVCDPTVGLTIDPAYFRDVDGKQYLFWRAGLSSLPGGAHLLGQELTDDGMNVTGEVFDTGIRNDPGWERETVEGAAVFVHDGTYYMLYAGNNPFTADYAVGYASSDNARGPYTKASENPILASRDRAAGPGHAAVFADKDGDRWVVYHSWLWPRVGYEIGGRRTMWIDELVVEDGKLRILGPDSEPQPRP